MIFAVGATLAVGGVDDQNKSTTARGEKIFSARSFHSVLSAKSFAQ
jgi:hypothetical protein